MLRELKRGGQVYFLHNEVETIQNRRDKLAELLPEARIAVAHGQMPERDLERVMRDFVAQRHNVLLCSTIIETGIDVPTANTIVISRADKFGLAQLHQLRGRVGRCHHQAYAYLLVPDTDRPDQAGGAAPGSDPADGRAGQRLLPRDARPGDPRRRRSAGRKPERQHDGSRLPALHRHADRSRARAEGRQGARPAVAAGRLSAPPPRSTCTSPPCCPTTTAATCTSACRCTSAWPTAETPARIDALLEEVTDRFGKLPPQGQTLFDTHRLRVLAKPYGVVKIDAGPKLQVIGFRPNPPIDATRIIELVQKNRHIKLAGNDKLRIERDLASPTDRAQQIRDVLRALGPVTAN